MFVYFIELETPTQIWVKIGKSNDPKKRLSSLQVASPYPLKLLAQIRYPDEKTSFKAEALAHKAFGQERGCGEWFLLNGTKKRLRLRQFIETMDESTKRMERKVLLEQQQEVFNAILNEVIERV